ncbi:MAG: hypothetical protein ACYTG7_23885, partial [Planctomycetota bacterium]
MMRTLSLALILSLIALFGLLMCSEEIKHDSSGDGSDFIRFVQEGEYQGRLEAAIMTYENEAGCRVDLVAAIHLADP